MYASECWNLTLDTPAGVQRVAIDRKRVISRRRALGRAIVPRKLRAQRVPRGWNLTVDTPAGARVNESAFHSLAWMLRSGVGWDDRDAAVADLDVYSLADAEAGSVKPIASETDVRDGWR